MRRIKTTCMPKIVVSCFASFNFQSAVCWTCCIVLQCGREEWSKTHDAFTNGGISLNSFGVKGEMRKFRGGGGSWKVHAKHAKICCFPTSMLNYHIWCYFNTFVIIWGPVEGAMKLFFGQTPSCCHVGYYWHSLFEMMVESIFMCSVKIHYGVILTNSSCSISIMLHGSYCMKNYQVKMFEVF